MSRNVVSQSAKNDLREIRDYIALFTEENIEIPCVLHGARDIASLFGEN